MIDLVIVIIVLQFRLMVQYVCNHKQMIIWWNVLESLVFDLVIVLIVLQFGPIL